MKRSTLLEIQGVLVTANRSDLAKELVVGKRKTKSTGTDKEVEKMQSMIIAGGTKDIATDKINIKTKMSYIKKMTALIKEVKKLDPLAKNYSKMYRFQKIKDKLDYQR